VVTTAQRRAVVTSVAPTAGSERRACRWLGVHRSVVRYVPPDRGDDAVRATLRALASAHPRWGVPLLTDVLRRQGQRLNHKRVCRLDRLEGLRVGRRARTRVAGSRVPLPAATQPNEHWAMDVMRDTLADGRAFRTLNILDACTRVCLAIVVDTSLPGVRVVAVLEQLLASCGRPARLTLDNGPEFQSRALDAWAHQRGVTRQFSRPGKPVDNTFIEAFNGRVRDACLNQSCFLSLADAQRVLEGWRTHYNTARPHRGLAGRTPAEAAADFRRQALKPRLSA
jgi:putative transposase